MMVRTLTDGRASYTNQYESPLERNEFKRAIANHLLHDEGRRCKTVLNLHDCIQHFAPMVARRDQARSTNRSIPDKYENLEFERFLLGEAMTVIRVL